MTKLDKFERKLPQLFYQHLNHIIFHENILQILNHQRNGDVW